MRLGFDLSLDHFCTICELNETIINLSRYEQTPLVEIINQKTT